MYVHVYVCACVLIAAAGTYTVSGRHSYMDGERWD